jgi:hypothetical protein
MLGMARKKARHFSAGQVWGESAANRGDRKLDELTRTFCGNSHTACGYRLGVRATDHQA